MTDYKMIRVKRPEPFDGKMGIKLSFIAYYPRPTILDEGTITIENIDKLEPAPAEGWKPLCFDEHSMADEEYCDGEHETNWMGYFPRSLASLPMRERGLKLLGRAECRRRNRVAPHAGAWIETKRMEKRADGWMSRSPCGSVD